MIKLCACKQSAQSGSYPKNLEVDGITVDATNEVEPALMPPTIKDGGYHWIGCHQQWRSGPALATSSLRADKRQWCIRIYVLWLEKAFEIKNLPVCRTLPFSGNYLGKWL